MSVWRKAAELVASTRLASAESRKGAKFAKNAKGSAGHPQGTLPPERRLLPHHFASFA